MNPFEVFDVSMPPHRLVIFPRSEAPGYLDVDPERDLILLRHLLESADLEPTVRDDLRRKALGWPGVRLEEEEADDHAIVVQRVINALEDGVLVAAIGDEGDTNRPTTLADIREIGAKDRPIAGASQSTAVSGMAYSDKLMKTLEMVPDEVGREAGAAAKREIEDLFWPANIAVTAGVFIVWAGSHAVGAGFVVSGALLGVALIFAGRAALDAFDKIWDFFATVETARSEAQLRTAARALAAAIALLGVAGFRALLRKVAPKRARGTGGKGDAGESTSLSQMQRGKTGDAGTSLESRTTSNSGGASGSRTGQGSGQRQASEGRPPPPSPSPALVRSQRLTDHRTGRTITRDVDLQPTLDRIARGERAPRRVHRRDGTVHRNREGKLPAKPEGYYREYHVPTDEFRPPGPQRIITGEGGEVYYTPNHYESFQRIK